MKITQWTQHWHEIGSSLRLIIIGIAGLLAFLLLTTTLSLAIRLAMSWIVAGGLYLFLTYLMMYFSNKENILSLSKREDDGAAVILLIIVLASIASLIAIVVVLSGVKSLSVAEAIPRIVLVILTYSISWFFVHTAFSLRYAHIYYQELEKTKEAPLIFASKLRPTYIDFLYFSMVIGMTCQTADVNIASSKMRYLVMIQGITAFIFNATLLAMAINLIAGAVAID
jgi:uncharacterized membrane protein